MICLISSVQIFGITNMRIGMPRTWWMFCSHLEKWMFL
jgi:hypothetical protein